MNVNINGVSITVADGSSVSIINGVLYVNGNPFELDQKLEGIVTLKVEGTLGALSLDRGSVHVTGDVGGDVKCGGNATVGGRVVGSVDASGSVSCGDVEKSVSAGGSANCRNVQGDVRAGGSVNCGTVGGSAKAGGSIRRG